MSRFYPICRSNRAEKQVAAKVRLYLAVPEYFINIRYIQLLQQLTPDRDNIVVRFLRRKTFLLSMLGPVSGPRMELG